MIKLNNTIANVPNFPSKKSMDDLLNIFIQSQNNPLQCSDLSKFPELFE